MHNKHKYKGCQWAAVTKEINTKDKTINVINNDSKDHQDMEAAWLKEMKENSGKMLTFQMEMIQTNGSSVKKRKKQRKKDSKGLKEKKNLVEYFHSSHAVHQRKRKKVHR